VPKAKTPDHVAAIEGRITVVNGLPLAAGSIKMGTANHTARLVLTAHAKDPETRAVINIKYIPEFIKPLADEGFFLFQIRREDQPDTVKSYEQNSMQWIISQAYSIINKIPDIIWDCGEPEKEPMMRLFGKDAKDLIDKIKGLIRAYKRMKENKQ
jgi:hydroxymethylpyrimidine/phosphomethylpyrimidine kinase